MPTQAEYDVQASYDTLVKFGLFASLDVEGGHVLVQIIAIRHNHSNDGEPQYKLRIIDGTVPAPAWPVLTPWYYPTEVCTTDLTGIDVTLVAQANLTQEQVDHYGGYESPTSSR